MEVKDDLYDVVDEIKGISAEYFVEFNPRTLRYELHSHYLRPTYVLTFPYDRLDRRAVTHTLKTRVANIDRLIEEIERDNLSLEKSATDRARKELRQALEEAASKVL